MRERGAIYFGTAVVFMVVGAICLFLYQKQPAADPAPKQEAQVTQATSSQAPTPEGDVTLQLGDDSHTVSWHELGVGDSFDHQQVQKHLEKTAAEFDDYARDARLDLENNKIIKEADGIAVNIPAALSRLEAAYELGQNRVELPTLIVKPKVTVEDLGISDISHVLGQFETKYNVRKRSRNYNLKLAASKINGYVMQPGEEISFNEVVGARSEQEGYKIAGVIQAGQMVDGLAGGTCQISSTLHGASFFAGLAITKRTPHSRPSTYVRAGLDATVVYPVNGHGVDLKLKNEYDFPVAIHFIVARGITKVRILGKKRPWDKVVFERKVRKEIPFDSSTREDDTMPVGSMTVDQPGYPGYELFGYRKFYKGKKLVKTEKSNIYYRPVTEYVRVGINPNPNLTVPKSKKKKNLNIIKGSGRMAQ